MQQSRSCSCDTSMAVLVFLRGFQPLKQQVSLHQDRAGSSRIYIGVLNTSSRINPFPPPSIFPQCFIRSSITALISFCLQGILVSNPPSCDGQFASVVVLNPPSIPLIGPGLDCAQGVHCNTCEGRSIHIKPMKEAL